MSTCGIPSKKKRFIEKRLDIGSLFDIMVLESEKRERKKMKASQENVERASQESIERAYEYLSKYSRVFRNLSMDEQGKMSIKLAKIRTAKHEVRKQKQEK